MKQTPQIKEWTGDFGRKYTERNCFTPEAHDRLYQADFGESRRGLNRRFLQQVPKGARILEVGCNVGNQLVLLQQVGYSNLFGLEIQAYALALARARARDIHFIRGSAFDIPFPDRSFDLVFTSRVLIHISMEDLPEVLAEIHRVSKTHIWGLEYYSPRFAEVKYRDHAGLLWKADYARIYLERFCDLELVREQRLPYLHTENEDCMFLLRRTENQVGNPASGTLRT